MRSCRELINYEVLQWHKIGRSCRYENKYYNASNFVKDEILDYLHNECVNYKKFIRIEPYYSSDMMPPIFLGEEALRPANPSWIKNLKLFKGQKTGGHYILQEPTTNENKLDQLKFWEYNIYGIRSLEIHAQRSNSENLSMMIEEISEKQTYVNYYVAKCIHLDPFSINWTLQS